MLRVFILFVVFCSPSFAEKGFGLVPKQRPPHGLPGDSICRSLVFQIVADPALATVLRDRLLETELDLARERLIGAQLEHETLDATSDRAQALAAEIAGLIADNLARWVPRPGRDAVFRKGLLSEVSFLLRRPDTRDSTEIREKITDLVGKIPTLTLVTSKSEPGSSQSIREFSRTRPLRGLFAVVPHPIPTTSAHYNAFDPDAYSPDHVTMSLRVSRDPVNLRFRIGSSEFSDIHPFFLNLGNIAFAVRGSDGRIRKVYFTNDEGFVDIPLSELSRGETVRLLGG